jgi:nitroreductase
MTRITINPVVKPIRIPEHGVDPLFLNRWSPRAMSGEPVTDAELRRLFEAARWAPSSYNEQPWRFVHARRDTPNWDPFLAVLAEPNRVWCVNAAALVIFLSKRTFTHNSKPNRVHAFDTGSAWMSMALQGSLMGLVLHGMVGFDPVKAAELVGSGSDYEVQAMCAIGRPAPASTLPEPLREREQPSGRRPLAELMFEGRFGV